MALGDGSKLLAGDPTGAPCALVFLINCLQMLAAADPARMPGIDMGVFLVRNNAFIRGLFAELAKRAVGLPVPTKVIT